MTYFDVNHIILKTEKNKYCHNSNVYESINQEDISRRKSLSEQFSVFYLEYWWQSLALTTATSDCSAKKADRRGKEIGHNSRTEPKLFIRTP